MADHDSDGVLDSDDQCVDVPQGDRPTPRAARCPSATRDGDGTLGDADDQCADVTPGRPPRPRAARCLTATATPTACSTAPTGAWNVPARTHPSTVRVGCPAPDNDHDNIIDQPEGPIAAPDQAETFNGVRTTTAAPMARCWRRCPAARCASSRRELPHRPGRDRRRPEPGARLGGSDPPGLAEPQVDVQGHTDYRRSAAHNLDLSNRRAAAVRRYLMAHDIVEERLDSARLRQHLPRRAGTNAAARRANRRVQFVIITGDTPAGRCPAVARWPPSLPSSPPSQPSRRDPARRPPCWTPT
ncbi:MAG: OmpA family protein [Deltaproteobacteria bacterium]|nr:OmpA family protein [Deltaproteobacteria bacterium]